MMKDLSNYRKNYTKNHLNINDLEKKPLIQFNNWFEEAEKIEDVEVNAMTVTTISQNGYPKSRILLLKHFSQDGFYFYTNYKSEKGEAIEFTTKGCLSFFWPKLVRQVIIKGNFEKIPTKQSEDYFSTRPRESQLTAWASKQGSPVSLDELKDNYYKYERQFEGKEIPKPEYWGGYRLIPVSFEFWYGRESRMHDRFVYSKRENDYKIERLAP